VTLPSIPIREQLYSDYLKFAIWKDGLHKVLVKGKQIHHHQKHVH